MTDKLTYPTPADAQYGTVEKHLRKLTKTIKHRSYQETPHFGVLGSDFQSSIAQYFSSEKLYESESDFLEIMKSDHRKKILRKLYGPIVERLNEIRSGSLTIIDDENKCDFLIDEISDLIRELCPKE